MGSFLKSWMITKDTTLLGYCIKEKYKSFLTSDKLNLISMFLEAIPPLCGENINSKPVALTYLEYLHPDNKMYKLPAAPSLRLGYGTCFRFGKTKKDPDITSTTINRVILRKDDFLMLEDSEEEMLESRMAEVFYENNKEKLDDLYGEISSLSLEDNITLFNNNLEEKRGSSKYSVDLLTIYGHKHTKNGEEYIDKKKKGYEFLPNTFPESLLDRDASVDGFFFMLERIRDIHKSYYENIEGIRLNASIFTLKNKNGNTYQVNEIYKKSETSNHTDRIGLLFRISHDNDGADLSNILHTTIVSLKKSMEKFRKGSNINIIASTTESAFNKLNI